jgi:hypothetical protein
MIQNTKQVKPKKSKNQKSIFGVSLVLDYLELRVLSDREIESQKFLLKPNNLPRGITFIILGTVYHPPQNNNNYPVWSIFNSSIREGLVPALWKSADVLPLPKISNLQSVECDLRPWPNSLTPVLSKILEDYIFQWLCTIIMPYIDPRQFGYIKKSSSTAALIHLLHTWLAATETLKTFIRSCHVDFSRAFNTINHNILLSKLCLLYVPPTLLNWCASFLRNRQQRVKLQSVKSGWNFIHAGVPQGKKLGPLFFLVMINDLTTTVPMYKFVDDVTMSEIISLHPNDEANFMIASTSSHLQDEINAVT